MKYVYEPQEFSGKREKYLHIIRNIGVILLGSLFFAAGVGIFLAPNDINVGGFVGIAQTIGFAVNGRLSIGLLLILCNIPVIALGGFFLSRRFIVKTAAEVLFTGLFMIIFNHFDIAGRLGLNDGTNVSLISLMGGALVALSASVTLAVSGSSGGTDILGLIMQKKYKMSNVSRLLLIFDVAVIALFAIIKDSAHVFFYSVTALAAYQITLELIFNGMSNAVMFEVITDDCAALVKALSEKLGRGSTMFKAVGTYTRDSKQVLICVVRKRQETRAKAIIKEIAPDSFAYSLPIKEVIGKGFRNINL